MRRIMFVLFRDGESTCAIVTVDSVSPAIHNADSAFDAIRRAVTGWVADTSDGRSVWIDSCEDMNIGDLASAGIPASLRKYLRAEGIRNLEIDIPDTGGVDACNYTFDSHLVDESRIPARSE